MIINNIITMRKQFKLGDRIISNGTGYSMYQKGYTYTFLRYYDKNSYYLQVRECIKASPDHGLSAESYEHFTWIKYIIYNIQRFIQIRNRQFYCRTVTDYCRWRPFRKTDTEPIEYFNELAKLDKLK